MDTNYSESTKAIINRARKMFPNEKKQGMQLIRCSPTPASHTFDLKELNRHLIAKIV